MVPGLSGNLPFTASVEAQLDAFANAYFRPETVIPGVTVYVSKATPDILALWLLIMGYLRLPTLEKRIITSKFLMPFALLVPMILSLSILHFAVICILPADFLPNMVRSSPYCVTVIDISKLLPSCL